MIPETHIGDDIYVSFTDGILRIEALTETDPQVIYLSETNYIMLQEYIAALPKKDR